ncbi:chemotaxis protein CheW [Brevundimonas sp.]
MPSSSDHTQTQGLVSIRVGEATFGVPVLSVQDVIAPVRIDIVPLAPPEVAGSLNLRGRIVTAIDIRKRLGMFSREAHASHMSVIVERSGELYALQVDDVGDVLWLAVAEREPAPITLTPDWRAVCDGLYRLEGELMLVLDVERVLTLTPAHPLAA